MAAAAPSRFAPGGPVTPSKSRDARDDVRRIIEDLNATYNIGIRLPDYGQSPSARGLLSEEHQVHLTICNRLQFQFYHGQLEGILARFDRIARRICQNWIRKPRADRDLLPVSLESPQATSVAEKTQLRDALVALLEKASPRKGAHVGRSNASRSEERPGATAAGSRSRPGRPGGSAIEARQGVVR